MKSIKSTARLAGILYLIVVVCGIFAEKYVRSSMVDVTSGIKTIENITNNEFLFRLGFVSDLLMQLAYFLLPLVLYRIFEKTDRWLSSVMVLSVTIAVSIMCVNMLNHYAPLLVIQEKGLQGIALSNQILFYLNSHRVGYCIAQLFFGLWLFPLGNLLIKSRLFPKVIGIMLMLGCIGYMVDFGLYFLFPPQYESFTDWITLPADLGEFSFCLFLLIKGVKKVPNHNYERLQS